MGGGLYFLRDRQTGELKAADGDQFIAGMDAWVKDKSWYHREIADPKCTGGKRWKNTPTKGVQGMGVSCAPWWSNLIYEAARNGEAEKVKKLSRQIAAEMKTVVEKQNRRQALSVQIHYDTVNLHAHVFSTRIGDDPIFGFEVLRITHPTPILKVQISKSVTAGGPDAGTTRGRERTE